GPGEYPEIPPQQPHRSGREVCKYNRSKTFALLQYPVHGGLYTFQMPLLFRIVSHQLLNGFVVLPELDNLRVNGCFGTTEESVLPLQQEKLCAIDPHLVSAEEYFNCDSLFIEFVLVVALQRKQCCSKCQLHQERNRYQNQAFGVDRLWHKPSRFALRLLRRQWG